MKLIISRFLLVLVFVLLSARPSLAQDWWSMSDQDFVKQYANLATGTQEQQSRFAWMAFARVNQQVTYSGDQKKYSQWELWPSDHDTFAPNVPAFTAANKIRLVPHLQQSRLGRFLPQARSTSGPSPGDEEVTRNPISYGYIMGKGLNTKAGIAKYLATPANKIDFPLGAIEIKAGWAAGAIAGAYQALGYSLEALHIMVKVAPTPSDPYKDNAPSWFWTTFELKTNQGLAYAQKKFETYGDVLPAGQAGTLLAQAGLGGTAFANYVSDGQQIQFSDAKHKIIRLGNTKLEWFLVTPLSSDPKKAHDPTTWTNWATSCHTCHGQASGQVVGNTMKFLDFTPSPPNGGPVGPLAGPTLPPAGYRSLDFVWALASAR